MKLNKRLSGLLTALMILTFLVPANPSPAEAGGSWSAWIYNYDTGQMVHVMPDGGAIFMMPFPLPPGTSTNPTDVVISRDGRLLAACLWDDAGNPSVRVYDIYNNIYVAAYIPAGPILSCSLQRYSFSPDGSQVAFGILNHWPDPANPRPDWEVVVMATNGTSAITNRITSSSPAITALGIDTTGTTPFVTAYEPGVIAFAPVRYATEGAPEYYSIVWQLAAGTAAITGPYGKSSLDYLIPNGEAIWVEERDDFPKGFLDGMGHLFNVVMYSNKAGAWYPILNNGASVLSPTRMIEDGLRIATKSYTHPNTYQWIWLDRAGGTGPLPIPGEIWDLWGTPDGYVYIHPTGSPVGGPMLTYHRYVPGGLAPAVQNMWTGDPGSFWRIIWVNPLSGGAGLPPFPAIDAAGELGWSPEIQELAIGGNAIIHTTEGDMLRIRSGPGTNFAVQFQLPDSTVVHLLDGPVAGGIYEWWFIQTDDGRTGWAVEGVPEGNGWLHTLLPIG